ncbi:MAG: methyltransferase domain-containing protein [Phycisphaeraceae bacterium]
MAILADIARCLRSCGLSAPAAIPRASTGYRIVADDASAGDTHDGWHDQQVAQRQHEAYRGLLKAMHAGQPRRDLLAAAQAVHLTGLASPTILEIGCGSGYYADALAHLLGQPIRYTGVDYSPAMIELAQATYPAHAFHVGDATSLALANGAFDIVLNGACLMHVRDYAAAIAEARRVARHWCIFHTVPTVRRRATTLLEKQAYGRPTIEVVFNQAHLRTMLAQAGLIIRHELASEPYDVSAMLGEPTPCLTLVCQCIATAKGVAA